MTNTRRDVTVTEVPAPRPAFHPAQGTARETRPVPVALPRRKPVPARAARVLPKGNERLLRWLLDGLRAYDPAAPGRNLSPVHEAVRRDLRLGAWPSSRRGEAALRRAQALAYPPFEAANVAGLSAYAKVMEHASRITGTRGTGQFRPALPAGDTR
jgi:hypothetical protein